MSAHNSTVYRSPFASNVKRESSVKVSRHKHHLNILYSSSHFPIGALPLTVYVTVPVKTRNAPPHSTPHVTFAPSNNSTLSTRETALGTTRTSVTVSVGARVVRRLTPATQRSCVKVLVNSAGSTVSRVIRATTRGRQQLEGRGT